MLKNRLIFSCQKVKSIKESYVIFFVPQVITKITVCEHLSVTLDQHLDFHQENKEVLG